MTARLVSVPAAQLEELQLLLDQAQLAIIGVLEVADPIPEPTPEVAIPEGGEVAIPDEAADKFARYRRRQHSREEER